MTDFLYDWLVWSPCSPRDPQEFSLTPQFKSINSWTWVIISFPILRKFSTIIPPSIFSWSFFLSSSSGTPMIQMLGCLIFSCRSLRLSSFLLIHFSFFLSDSFISTILSSPSLILSSASVILLLLPPECFWSHLLHFSLYIHSFLFLLCPG